MLSLLYGKSVRAVQCLNALFSLFWTTMATITWFGLVPLNIPKELENNYLFIHIVTGLILLFTWFWYIAESLNRKQLFKVASLLFGSMLQAVISNFYISNYPPFEPMMVISITLSIWFLGAVIYIFEVEGYNGRPINTN